MNFEKEDLTILFLEIKIVRKGSMKEHREDLQLLDTYSDKFTSSYGAINRSISPDKQAVENNCNIDVDALAATAAAYVGGLTAGSFVFTTNRFCQCLDMPSALTIAMTMGLGSAALSFFASRKLLKNIIAYYENSNKLKAEENNISLF